MMHPSDSVATDNVVSGATSEASNGSDAGVYDILIVGGGMAGAALGCALGQAGSGWRIGLVDPAPLQIGSQAMPTADPNSFDLRVSALTQASERFLRSLGVW